MQFPGPVAATNASQMFVPGSAFSRPDQTKDKVSPLRWLSGRAGEYQDIISLSRCETVYRLKIWIL